MTILDRLADHARERVEEAKRNASFRDMENIINLSKNFYLEDMMANESAKFKFEYLEKGMNNYNATDGEIYVK